MFSKQEPRIVESFELGTCSVEVVEHDDERVIFVWIAEDDGEQSVMLCPDHARDLGKILIQAADVAIPAAT